MALSTFFLSFIVDTENNKNKILQNLKKSNYFCLSNLISLILQTQIHRFLLIMFHTSQFYYSFIISSTNYDLLLRFITQCTTVNLNSSLGNESLSIIDFSKLGSLFFNYDLLYHIFL